MEHLISVFESLGYKYRDQFRIGWAANSMSCLMEDKPTVRKHFFFRPTQGEWAEYSFVIYDYGRTFKYSIGLSMFISDERTDTDLMMREIFSEIKKIGGFETSELRDLQINNIID